MTTDLSQHEALGTAATQTSAPICSQVAGKPDVCSVDQRRSKTTRLKRKQQPKQQLQQIVSESPSPVETKLQWSGDQQRVWVEPIRPPGSRAWWSRSKRLERLARRMGAATNEGAYSTAIPNDNISIINRGINVKSNNEASQAANNSGAISSCLEVLSNEPGRGLEQERLRSRPVIAISEPTRGESSPPVSGISSCLSPASSSSSSSSSSASLSPAQSFTSISSQAQPSSAHSVDWPANGRDCRQAKCQSHGMLLATNQRVLAPTWSGCGPDNSCGISNNNNNNSDNVNRIDANRSQAATSSTRFEEPNKGRDQYDQGNPMDDGTKDYEGHDNKSEDNNRLADTGTQLTPSSNSGSNGGSSTVLSESNKSYSTDGCIVDDVRENFVGLIRYNKLQYFYIGVLIYSVINVILLMEYLPASLERKNDAQLIINGFNSELLAKQSPKTIISSDQIAVQFDANTPVARSARVIRELHDASVSNQNEAIHGFVGTKSSKSGATKTETISNRQYGNTEVRNSKRNCVKSKEIEQRIGSQTSHENIGKLNEDNQLIVWLLVLIIISAALSLALIIMFTFLEFNNLGYWSEMRLQLSNGTTVSANETKAQAQDKKLSSFTLLMHIRSIGLLLAFILLVAPICTLNLSDYYLGNKIMGSDECLFGNESSMMASNRSQHESRSPIVPMAVYIYTITFYWDEMSLFVRLLASLGLVCPIAVGVPWSACNPFATNQPEATTNFHGSRTSDCISSLIIFSIALIGGSLKARHLSRFTKRRVFMGANQLIEAKVSLEQQRQQQETLLLSVLPAYVAEQVKRNMVKKMANLISQDDANCGFGGSDLSNAGAHDPLHPNHNSAGGSSWLAIPSGEQLSAQTRPQLTAPANGQPISRPAPLTACGQLSGLNQRSVPSYTEMTKLQSKRPPTPSNVAPPTPPLPPPPPPPPPTTTTTTSNINNNNRAQQRFLSTIKHSRFSYSLGSNEPAANNPNPSALTTAARQHYHQQKAVQVAHQASLVSGGNLQHIPLSNTNSNQFSQAQHQLSSINLVPGFGANQQTARRGFNELYIRTYNNVSLLYGDIVGFTRLCTQLSSSQLVSVLNDLFSHFDHLAERHKIMRIKILGDCYYGVSGIPEFAVMGAKSRAKSAGGDNHAINCVNMGLDMIQYIKCLNVRHSMMSSASYRLAKRQFQALPAFELNMRIGVHTGHIHSGVIGLKKWQFDIWSNDVSIAMHCESSGVAGRVQVTEATVQHLHGAFKVELAPGSERDQLLAERGIRTYLICDQKLHAPGGSMNGKPGQPLKSQVVGNETVTATTLTIAMDEREPIEEKIREATIGTIRQTLLAGETASACPFNAYALALDHNDLNPVYLTYCESPLERSFERRLIGSGARLMELFILFTLLVIVLVWLDLHLLKQFEPISQHFKTLFVVLNFLIGLMLLASLALAQSNGDLAPSSAIEQTAATTTTSTTISPQVVAETSIGDHQPIKTSVIIGPTHLHHQQIPLSNQQVLSDKNKLVTLISGWLQETSLQLNWLVANFCQHFCKRQANSKLGLLAILCAYLLVAMEQIFLISQQTWCQYPARINDKTNATVLEPMDAMVAKKINEISIEFQDRNYHHENLQQYLKLNDSNSSHKVARNIRGGYSNLKLNLIVETYQLTVVIILIALDLSVNLLNYKTKFNLILAILVIQSMILVANPFFATRKLDQSSPTNRLDLIANSSNKLDSKDGFLSPGFICLLSGNNFKHLESLTQQMGPLSLEPELDQEHQQEDEQRKQKLIYRSSDAILLVMALWSLAFARQLDYTNRTNFLWRNRLNVDHEELEYISGINKVLLENILPSHVVQYYLTNQNLSPNAIKRYKRKESRQALSHNHEHPHRDWRHGSRTKPKSKITFATPSSASPISLDGGTDSREAQASRSATNVGGPSMAPMMMMMASNLRYLNDVDELYHEQHDSVAVMFASIPHFYEFYDESDISKQGLGCIALLNEIICDFDKLLLKNKFSRIEKIKTIGSTYMAAAGLRPCHQLSSRHSAVSQISQVSGQSSATLGSNSNIIGSPITGENGSKLARSNEHTNQLVAPDYQLEERKKLVLSQQKLNLICMIQFATSLMGALNCINKQSFQVFKLRVGVNTGPVIAGVIGAQRPFYDIWGDCVNIASRMESLGEIGRIQVEERTAKLLLECLCTDTYTIVRRGPIEVKGKGGMVTYFVDKRKTTTSIGRNDSINGPKSPANSSRSPTNLFDGKYCKITRSDD